MDIWNILVWWIMMLLQVIWMEELWSNSRIIGEQIHCFVKLRLQARLSTSNGAQHTLECPVIKNPEVATPCDKNAVTEVLWQSTCVIRRMGPRKFPWKGAKTLQFVVLPIRKTGYTLRHYWQKGKTFHKKFNPINVLRSHFLTSQTILSENIYPATRVMLSLSGLGDNYWTCSVAISSKKSHL